MYEAFSRERNQKSVSSLPMEMRVGIILSNVRWLLKYLASICDKEILLLLETVEHARGGNSLNLDPAARIEGFKPVSRSDVATYRSMSLR